MINPILIATAIANGNTIYTDISGGVAPGGNVRVQATAPIQLLRPPGCFPTRPFLTGADAAHPDDGTYVVQAGQQFVTWGPESAALVAANVAVLVASV